METQSKRDELQRLMIEAETYKRQMEALKEELQILDSSMAEIRSAVSAIEALGEKKEGSEILVSIGAGSYVKACLKDAGNVIVNVGAGVSMEKGLEEAKVLLEKRISDLADAMEKMQKRASDINQTLSSMDSRYRTLVSEVSAAQKQV